MGGKDATEDEVGHSRTRTEEDADLLRELDAITAEQEQAETTCNNADGSVSKLLTDGTQVQTNPDGTILRKTLAGVMTQVGRVYVFFHVLTSDTESSRGIAWVRWTGHTERCIRPR